MVVFDQFELAPGLRLSARVSRACVHGLRLDPAHVHEDFIARYLATSATSGTQGELWLEEVRNQEGQPLPLRAVPPEVRRSFFARFVGFVLRDGGLIDTLTVRENILLPFRYHQLWPRAAELDESAMADLLKQLAGEDVAGVAASMLLDRRPPELTPFARRYWGLLKTLMRRPQLLIVFAPFDGLGLADQAVIARLLARYRVLEPLSAHLLVLTGVHETNALAGTDWTELNAEQTLVAL